MTHSNPLLTEESVNNNSTYSSATEGSNPNNSGFTKIAIGVFIGATLGGIAAALANRDVTERINQTIRGLGKTAKATADGLNDSVQRVGDAVNSVAVNINDASSEVNHAVNSVTTTVGSTVKNTVTTVKGTAEGMTETVKTAMNVVNTVKDSVSGVQEAVQTVNAPSAPTEVSNGETLYKLVPVSPEPPAS